MDKIEVLRLTIIALGAYAMPFVGKRLMLPSSVGELLFGMFIGTFLFSPAELGSVKLLSELGFILLVYIAGLELDIDRIWALNKRELAGYGSYALLLVVTSFGAAYLLGMPVFFTLVIMTSAIGLLFSVIKELNLVKTQIGQAALLVGAIGEVLTLSGMTLVSITVKADTFTDVVIQAGGVVLFVVVIIMAIKSLKLVLWWIPEIKSMFMSVGGASEIGIRANLLNMFLFAAIAAFLDLELILGAFFGGVVFAMLFADREEMLERLSSFGYGFLVPFFFIEVGTRFSFADFLSVEVLLSSLLLMIVILVVRAVSTLGLLFTNIQKKQLIYIPLAQSFPLTLMVAVSTLGYGLGFLSQSQSSVIILTAIISAIIYPWFMKFINKAIPVREEQ